MLRWPRLASTSSAFTAKIFFGKCNSAQPSLRREPILTSAIFSTINADIGALTLLLLKLVTEAARELKKFAAALADEPAAPIE